MNDNTELDYNFEKHWNNAYQKTPVDSLGWHEENPTASMELIERCGLLKDALIFNAGAGASSLVENLLNEGYLNLVVNDISSSALIELKNNLTRHNHSSVEFILDDLTDPSELLKLKNIDLWHDRAVLHFFIEERQIHEYFKLLKGAVKIGGFVILAEFSQEGANKCCGLDVLNYNEEMLQDRLGEQFKLIESFNYTYTQPSGNTREYVYTLFKRTA